MKDGSLNRAQIEVLKALSNIDSEEDVLELKLLITNFFSRKADAAMEQLWKSGEWDDAKLASFEHTHFRTPY